MASISIWRLLCIALLCTLTISTIQVNSESQPTESECRPHIEKALNTLKGDAKEDSEEVVVDLDDSNEKNSAEDLADAVVTEDDDNSEEVKSDVNDNTDNDSQEESTNETETGVEDNSTEADDGAVETNQDDDSKENDTDDSQESDNDSKDTETNTNEEDSKEDEAQTDSKEDENSQEQADQDSGEQADDDQSKENEAADADSGEANDSEQKEESAEADDDKKDESGETASKEEGADGDSGEQKDDADDSGENGDAATDNDESGETKTEATSTNAEDSKEDDDSADSKEADKDDDDKSAEKSDDDDSSETDDDAAIKKRDVGESREITTKSYPVDDLLLESEIPENLRDRSHIDEILHLNEDSTAQNEVLEKIADKTLNDLKKIYENAIKPLETLYKYRDLSNRHFGDPEIFSKPLVVLMGPWSGGKSTIINYLTDNEYTEFSLKTGAEPTFPHFNIVTYGETEEVLDGTQLSADWTFSGLQKFGQGLTDRLRGLKLPSKLLQKVNIVEIPGIMEVRKHVSRVFPFNDACQWFIDRADIIFLTYDPSKLDAGPETEAILDQLKGREYQTRIVLNKADQVHPEELLRVQSALIWNISPLMSSQQPPVLYTVSLWSAPFEENTPVRLLQAQEKALLQDLAQAIDHRIENKIASARRFAVRVRNHAKMVDCYLTTYYNHKTLFGNKKKISGEIIEHPQTYHIYEGLSTLTNISRYDLPDPEVYRDFFKLNPLYEFKKLSETCTYFRGCPINKLDVAIAYDLPELVNRYKRAVVQALTTLELGGAANDSSPSPTDRR